MKKIYLSLLLITLSLSAVASNLLYSEKDFPPFSFKKNGKVTGIDIDVMNEISKRVNFPVEIKLIPWKKLLKETENGKCVGSFALFQTAEREKWAHFTEVPVHFSTYSIFVKKGKEFAFNKISDLYGKKLAMTRGFNISDEFDKAIKDGKIKVHEVNSQAQFYALTEKGRVDGFIGNKLVTFWKLKEKGNTSFTKLPKDVKSGRGAFLVISKKGSAVKDKKALIGKMNSAYKAMVSEGLIKKIENNYK